MREKVREYVKKVYEDYVGLNLNDELIDKITDELIDGEVQDVEYDRDMITISYPHERVDYIYFSGYVLGGRFHIFMIETYDPDQATIVNVYSVDLEKGDVDYILSTY